MFLTFASGPFACKCAHILRCSIDILFSSVSVSLSLSDPLHTVPSVHACPSSRHCFCQDLVIMCSMKGQVLYSSRWITQADFLLQILTSAISSHYYYPPLFLSPSLCLFFIFFILYVYGATCLSRAVTLRSTTRKTGRLTPLSMKLRSRSSRSRLDRIEIGCLCLLSLFPDPLSPYLEHVLATTTCAREKFKEEKTENEKVRLLLGKWLQFLRAVQEEVPPRVRLTSTEATVNNEWLNDLPSLIMTPSVAVFAKCSPCMSSLVGCRRLPSSVVLSRMGFKVHAVSKESQDRLRVKRF